VALTKAQRAARRAEVLDTLRARWVQPKPRARRVELILQRGRARPRVTGRVEYVATSGAFVLLGEDDWTDDVDLGAVARHSPTLHVPVDVIRSVRPV
jgi:hypothetical protein